MLVRFVDNCSEQPGIDEKASGRWVPLSVKRDQVMLLQSMANDYGHSKVHDGDPLASQYPMTSPYCPDSTIMIFDFSQIQPALAHFKYPLNLHHSLVGEHINKDWQSRIQALVKDAEEHPQQGVSLVETVAILNDQQSMFTFARVRYNPAGVSGNRFEVVNSVFQVG